MPSSSPSPSVAFVFNGDADGIVSQHLAELSGLRPDLRITGLKREIRLLERLPSGFAGTAWVFDISLDANRPALGRLLGNPDVAVRWFDHHEPGEIPASPRLETRIVTARGTCTGLIAHAEFPGADPRWAAMAAFGDNVPEAADALLRPLGIAPEEREAVREAGELLNYNAYGETIDDVLVPPLQVAERMRSFRTVAEFLQESGLIPALREQLRLDEEKMGVLSPVEAVEGAALYRLPAEPWARRLGSTFANRAALAEPGRAVAVLHPLRDGSFQVSIRAPRGRPDAPAAADLAREYPSGGGRALAAGINRLPEDQVDTFARRFHALYGRPAGRPY